MEHVSVLIKEVLQYADPRPNQNFIDATVGAGGHALAVLQRIQPSGKALGLDLDEKTIDDLAKKTAGTDIENRLILVCGNFADVKKIAKEKNFAPIHGIIADLGLSSMELEKRGRGFSFLKDERIDMRFGESELTAENIVNEFGQEELAEIFKKYGEERFSEQIAEKIIQARKTKRIETTFQLVELIKSATPSWYHHRRLHPATKIFQALRIAVNEELENLNKFLPEALAVLEKGGRLVIISFHSLEDRIVKNFFKDKAKENAIKILTKKAVRPEAEEAIVNPRSRSAKLRAAIKL